MTFGYVGESKKDLISDYKVSGDKILVNFLDGSTYSTPFSNKNELKILSIMLKQAEDRRDKGSLEKTEKMVIAHCMGMITTFLVTTFSIATLSAAQMVPTFVIVYFTLGMLANHYGLLQQRYKLDELQKYDIFLDMKDELETASKEEVFKGVKNKQKTLNINTIDKYSLDEVRQINSNLKRI